MAKKFCTIQECPECGSDNIICYEEKNQLMCRDCGLIYEPLAPKAEKKFKKAAGTNKKAKKK